jgi:hypothetical protein
MASCTTTVTAMAAAATVARASEANRSASAAPSPSSLPAYVGTKAAAKAPSAKMRRNRFGKVSAV